MDLSDEERNEVISQHEMNVLKVADGLETDDAIVIDDEEYSLEESDGGEDFENDPNFSNTSQKRQKSKSKTSKKTKASLGKKRTTKKSSEYDAKVALCAAIRQHPAIYQITHQDYSDKLAKDAMWKNVCASVSSSIGREVSNDECRKMWNALRESTR